MKTALYALLVLLLCSVVEGQTVRVAKRCIISEPSDPLWFSDGSYAVVITCEEPIDVPAILHNDTRFVYCGKGGVSYCDHGENFSDRSSETCESVDEVKVCGGKLGKRWTCLDKSRILLHDEQTPPKYWCHRVER
jgi:hypothetical protein